MYFSFLENNATSACSAWYEKVVSQSKAIETNRSTLMAELFPYIYVALSEVERVSDYKPSAPRPIIKDLYKPVLIIYLKGNIERAYERYEGVKKYRHILGAIFFYLTHRSFRRAFTERIVGWRKSHEANLAEWEATYESNMIKIKQETDEWIDNCRRQIAEIQSRVAVKH